MLNKPLKIGQRLNRRFALGEFLPKHNFIYNKNNYFYFT